MPLKIVQDAPPLAVDEDGDVRVGGTRVTLNSVLSKFEAGQSPEDIASSFPALSIGDIYAVIAYYWRHQDDVDTYLRELRLREEQLRVQLESRHGKEGLRRRLIERRDSKDATKNASFAR